LGDGLAGKFSVRGAEEKVAAGGRGTEQLQKRQSASPVVFFKKYCGFKKRLARDEEKLGLGKRNTLLSTGEFLTTWGEGGALPDIRKGRSFFDSRGGAALECSGGGGARRKSGKGVLAQKNKGAKKRNLYYLLRASLPQKGGDRGEPVQVGRRIHQLIFCLTITKGKIQLTRGGGGTLPLPKEKGKEGGSIKR